MHVNLALPSGSWWCFYLASLKGESYCLGFLKGSQQQCEKARAEYKDGSLWLLSKVVLDTHLFELHLHANATPRGLVSIDIEDDGRLRRSFSACFAFNPTSHRCRRSWHEHHETCRAPRLHQVGLAQSAAPPLAIRSLTLICFTTPRVTRNWPLWW